MTTKTKPVSVSPGGKAGPYIMTPVQYVEQIHEFLTQQGIRFNIDHGRYKTQGVPEFTVFNITRDCTHEQLDEIKSFLDSVNFMWEFGKE